MTKCEECPNGTARFYIPGAHVCAACSQAYIDKQKRRKKWRKNR